MTETQNLDPQFRDKLVLEGYCPGFYLWNVLATDGNRYLMAGDHKGGVSTRLYFRTNGKLDVAEIEQIGPNPDAEEWSKARGMSH
jgi:hypothetical protein